MCLIVYSSHVKNPIPVMKVYKLLYWNRDIKKWETYYTEHNVPTDVGGYFCSKWPARRSEREFHYGEKITSGYLHSYEKLKNKYHRIINFTNKLPDIKDLQHSASFLFEAWAYDVVAIGVQNDIVSKTLYIPAFDLR